MEELCSLPRTTESDSARRKRFKIMMTLLILGILVISLIGTCGYFAYKGIMVTAIYKIINRMHRVIFLKFCQLSKRRDNFFFSNTNRREYGLTEEMIY